MHLEFVFKVFHETILVRLPAAKPVAYIKKILCMMYLPYSSCVMFFTVAYVKWFSLFLMCDAFTCRRSLDILVLLFRVFVDIVYWQLYGISWIKLCLESLILVLFSNFISHRYDMETIYFDEGVRTTKRQQLNSKALDVRFNLLSMCYSLSSLRQ